MTRWSMALLCPQFLEELFHLKTMIQKIHTIGRSLVNPLIDDPLCLTPFSGSENLHQSCRLEHSHQQHSGLGHAQRRNSIHIQILPCIQ